MPIPDKPHVNAPECHNDTVVSIWVLLAHIPAQVRQNETLFSIATMIHLLKCDISGYSHRAWIDAQQILDEYGSKPC